MVRSVDGGSTIAPLTLLLGLTLVVEPVALPVPPSGEQAPTATTAVRGAAVPVFGVRGTGPTGRGRIVVLAPRDPLGDPTWRLRERRLRIATKTSTGILGASIASMGIWFPLAAGINDDPGPRPSSPVFPWIALAVGAASLLATAGIGRIYDGHLRSASRHVAMLPDPRGDPAWVTRERTLSRHLYVSAAFTGVGFAAGPLLFAQDDDSQVPGLIITGVGLGALLALTITAVQLRNHRRRLPRWPRRGAGR